MSENTNVVNAGSEANPFPVEVAGAGTKPVKKAAKKTGGKPAAAKKASGKKAAPAKKAAAKKGATKGAAPAKKPAAPREKPIVNKPQARILALMAKAGRPLTRKQIAEKGPFDPASLPTYMGRIKPEVRKANEAKYGYTSLLTLGFISMQEREGEGITYSLTPAGRSALAKLG